jgi:hypothetical protein
VTSGKESADDADCAEVRGLKAVMSDAKAVISDAKAVMSDE